MALPRTSRLPWNGARFRRDDADETVAAASLEIRVGHDVTQERVELDRALFHQRFAAF